MTPWPAADIAFAPNDPAKILIGCAWCPDRRQYSNGGTAEEPLRFSQPPRAVLFSPDARRVAFEKNGDLWLGDADWKNGTVRNPRQITQVGVFNGGNGYWHGDLLLYSGYRISLTDHSVKEAPVGWFRLGARISPDAGTVLCSNSSAELFVYDLASGTSKSLLTRSNVRSYLWLDDSGAVLNQNNSEILYFDRRVGTLTPVVTNVDLQDGFGTLSPTGRYFFATEFMGEGRVLVFDRQNWSMTPVGKDIRNIAWASDRSFFFTREQPVDQRGTWLYDMASKSEKRITPYPFMSIAVVHSPGVAVFVANSNRWRVKLDGSGLTQLTSTDGEDGTLWAAAQGPPRSD